MHCIARVLASLGFGLIGPMVQAQHSGHAHHAPTGQGIELGAVIAPVWQSGAQALLARNKGLGLGHSDISADIGLMRGLKGRLSAAAHSHHASIETGIEEAYVEAPGLPGGLQVRAGRFLSQIGYLNEQHSHSDDFVMRPALYRAFLGDHYFDDGLRLNWVAPTGFYWRTGIEMLRGKRLPEQPAGGTMGAWSLGTRLGADLSRSSSWQVGLSSLRHGSGAIGAAGEVEHHHDHGHAEDPHGEAHHHRHGAIFFGRRIDLIDVVWKWAPDGNSKARQLRISGEFARVGGFGEGDPSAGRHQAGYLSVIYRFMPQWEAGLRFDRLRARALHEDAYEAARLDERSLSIAWKPSHMRAVRLQYTAQRDRGGLAEATTIAPDRALHLQFVQSLGAHGAHHY